MIKIRKWTTAMLSASLALALAFTPVAGAPKAFAAAEASDTAAIQEVLDYLEAYYVEGTDRSELIRAAIDGMVYSLGDPYSAYFDSDEAAAFGHELELEFVGIGATLSFADDELYIAEVLPGSPAQQAGLKRGDAILKINGMPLDDLTGDELDGAPGTSVTLHISRNGKISTVKVTLREITYPSVTGKLLGSKVGYISLNGFTEHSAAEFETKLQALRKAGMQSMVLDLRDNGGGYMQAAYDIAAQFMSKGVMMYTSDATGALSPVIVTGGRDIGMPVVILANDYTASASEALTGALQDNGIATVVGTRTYGKARVQNLIELSDGSLLKLTTERVLTPAKTDFNYVGLVPDFAVQDPTAQLIVGLQLAGLEQIVLSGDKRVLDVNGSPFNGNVGLLKQGNRIYASAKILAALTETELKWDAAGRQAVFTTGAGQRLAFTVASKDAVISGNVTYIDLNAFKKQVPALQWNYNQATGQLKLAFP